MYMYMYMYMHMCRHSKWSVLFELLRYRRRSCPKTTASASLIDLSAPCQDDVWWFDISALSFGSLAARWTVKTCEWGPPPLPHMHEVQQCTRPHTCQQTPCRSSSVHRSNKYSQVKLTNLYIVTETETRYGPWWSFGGKLVGYCTGPAKATKSSKDAFVTGAPKIYRLVGCPDMTCRWTDCFCVLDMVYMSTVGYLVAAYQIWWMPPDAEHRSQSI